MNWLWPVAAYLVGSIPMAIVVAWLFRLPDPRTTGSHNPGTTNILRYGGKTAAAVTLAGDVLKSVVVLVAAQTFAPEPELLAVSGLGVFLGHLYPLFFGFRGGKGVATALGVWLVLVPWVGLSLLVTWLVVAAAFRYSSLAALVAACLAPVYVLWLAPNVAYVTLSVVMSLLLVWRHRSNIRKLAAGTEGRIGAK
jgi:glycerol-3-phosphate acyltransferase PlsY